MIINKNKEKNNIRLFALGKFISVFGTSIYTFIMSLHVLKITNSGLGFAATLILSTIPMIIINPFGGVMADNFNKKKLVVSMDIVNGIFLIIIFFISGIKGVTLSIVYISTIVNTALTTIFDISMEAAKPELVSEENLIKLNSVSKIIDSLSSILGPVIGGIIFSIFDIRVFIIVNGISFIISGLLELLIDFNLSEIEKNKKVTTVSYIKEIKEGFNYIINKKIIKSILGIFLLFNFCISLAITVPFPFIINTVLGANSLTFGIIQSSIPIGMIIGSLIIKKIIERLEVNLTFVAMGAVTSLIMLLIAFTPIALNGSNKDSRILIYFIPIMFILGVVIAVIDIRFTYIMQVDIEESYRARALGIVMSIIKITVPISYGLSGVLITIYSPYLISLIGGIITSIISIILFKKIIRDKE